MTENVLPLEVASVTDRGLNERRPHNEDSMLADPARGLFVVADGVGGAQAGEVASQTTVEVIDENDIHALRHNILLFEPRAIYRADSICFSTARIAMSKILWKRE